MDILGAVSVSGFIAPTTATDIYPAHSEEWGRGGYRSVLDLVERDAITPQRRKEGMIVNVLSSGTEYKLVGGIDNVDWVINSSNTALSTTGIAAENIPDCSVVVSILGQVHLADNTIPSHSKAHKYFVRTGGLTGSTVTLADDGRITKVGWGLVQDIPYYLHTLGTISDVVPTVGFLQRIGIAITSDALELDASISITL